MSTQKKLRLSLDPSCHHVYICDHHKEMIQVGFQVWSSLDSITWILLRQSGRSVVEGTAKIVERPSLKDLTLISTNCR